MNSSDLEIYELIDLYLEEAMSEEEKESFEKRLEEDLEFRSEFEKQQELFLALNEHASISEIKQEVEHIIPKVTKKSGSSNYSFKQLLLTSGAVAACISFLFLGGFYFISSSNGNNNGSKKDKYLQISQKLSDVSSKQTDLWMLLKSAVTTPKEVPSTHLGTCIYLSDSIFLTSKHVLMNKNDIRINNWSCVFINEDSLHDLALVKVIDSTFINPKINFMLNTQSISLAQEVFSLGYPKKDIVYKSGVISSNSGFKSDTLQYEISNDLNPGNSGGPIFNSLGELIGISAGKSQLYKGSTFVVKSQYIKNYLRKNNIVLSTKNKVKYTNRIKQVEYFKKGVFRITSNADEKE